MRTIIVNTLGSGFSPKDLFFRAFRETDLLWISAPFAKIKTCADEIDRLRSQQSTDQGYHLVVLADVSCYALSAYTDVRLNIQKVMVAYVVKNLLPRLEELHDIPHSISMIFFSTETWPDKEGPAGFCRLLKLENICSGGRVLLQAADEDGTLDLTALVQDAVDCYRQAEADCLDTSAPVPPDDDDLLVPLAKTKQSIEEEKDAHHRKNLAAFDHDIQKTINSLQHYNLNTIEGVSLTPRICDFAAESEDDRKLAYADLQINLALLADQLMRSKSVEPALDRFRPHSKQQLAAMLERAKNTVDVCRGHDRNPRYYSLSAKVDEGDLAAVRSSLLLRLREDASDIPGITELTSSNAKNDAPVADTVFEKARACWFRIGKERTQFQEAYRELQKQYDPDLVQQNELRIMDCCIQEFSRWRDDTALNVSSTFVPSQEKRPKLQNHQLESTSETVQQLFLNGTLEKLADFADVQETAATLHQEFRQASRLWDPAKKRNGLAAFRLFSLVLSVISVLAMLIPYVFTAKGTTGVTFPETIVFLVSGVLFSLLYFLGVLVWLRQTCKTLHCYTQQLQLLIQDSRKRYMESLRKVIEMYGSLIPQCVAEHKYMEALSEIDAANEKIETCWKLHQGYLRSASDELEDLRTALRIESSGSAPDPKGIDQIVYELPPYAQKNRNVYLLFH